MYSNCVCNTEQQSRNSYGNIDVDFINKIIRKTDVQICNDNTNFLHS